jgi:general secretion pathway protein M
MSTEQTLIRYLVRYPALAAVLYGTLVAACLFLTWAAAAELYDRYNGLQAATALLDQIEGRRPAPGGSASAEAVPAGSPFLEGRTVTVAGAALQQRVASAVTKLGGNVLSTQVELQGSQAKEGFVSLVASCEMDQPALQQLLYDLEVGMPFLFVDQLQVETPQLGTTQEGERMRVLLAVSGQWQGAK